MPDATALNPPVTAKVIAIRKRKRKAPPKKKKPHPPSPDTPERRRRRRRVYGTRRSYNASDPFRENDALGKLLQITGQVKADLAFFDGRLRSVEAPQPAPVVEQPDVVMTDLPPVPPPKSRARAFKNDVKMTDVPSVVRNPALDVSMADFRPRKVKLAAIAKKKNAPAAAAPAPAPAAVPVPAAAAPVAAPAPAPQVPPIQELERRRVPRDAAPPRFVTNTAPPPARTAPPPIQRLETGGVEELKYPPDLVTNTANPPVATSTDVVRYNPELGFKFDAVGGRNVSRQRAIMRQETAPKRSTDVPILTDDRMKAAEDRRTEARAALLADKRM